MSKLNSYEGKLYHALMRLTVRGTLVKNVYVRRSREGQEDLGQGTQEGQLTEAVREEEREAES